MCNHTSPGSCLKAATRTAAKTVRNCLREAHLHAYGPHRGPNRTACCRRQLVWANAYIQRRLARRRGVFFMDESRFTLFRADGSRQHVRSCVGDRFSEVNVVDPAAHGGGRVVVRAGVCCGREAQVHLNDGIVEWTEIPCRDPESPLVCHTFRNISSCWPVTSLPFVISSRHQFLSPLHIALPPSLTLPVFFYVSFPSPRPTHLPHSGSRWQVINEHAATRGIEASCMDL